MADPSLKKIELIHSSSQGNLWDETVRAYAQALREHTFQPPRWIVADGRHRRAAEIALLRASGRSGFPTGGICTLASFAGEVLGWPVQTALASPTIASLTLTDLLSQNPPEHYRASSDKPGFASAFWSAVVEAESRGHFPSGSIPGAKGARPSPEFRDLQKRLHESLAKQQLCTPGKFLLDAIDALEKSLHRKSSITSSLFIGPILNLSPLDRAFLRALISRADHVRLALAAGLNPETWLNSADIQEGGDVSGFAQLVAEVLCLRPLTPEADLDAVFALIAEWAARGEFHYRDIRLIHPFLSEELPRLKSAAWRYRVPIRGDLGRPLRQFPGAIALLKVLDLFESGWGRSQLLDILRSRLQHSTPDENARLIARLLETQDRRSKKPWEHWLKLAEEVEVRDLAPQLLQLADLDKAASGRMKGAAFATWAESLADFVQAQQANLKLDDEDGWIVGFEDEGWKALRKLLQVMAQFSPQPQERGVHFELLRRSLGNADFAPQDDNADAVEVCSGKKEDHLPCQVVFYLSLHSRVPTPERTSPFLSESHSPHYFEQLRLFQLQLANARQKLILSCPQHDDGGDELARSPFLHSLPGLAEAEKMGDALLERALQWPPFATLTPQFRQATRDVRASVAGRAWRHNSVQILKRASRRWSATRLSNAIQCLYLHFAGDVLRLEPQADAMIEAATPPLLGRIAHQVLQEFVARRLRGEDYDIAQRCRDRFRQVTAIYEPHLETDRAAEELVRCLAHFARLGWERLAADFNARTDRLELAFGEEKRYPLLTLGSEGGEYSVEGIIDRLDQSADGRALLIEYKYRKAEGESKDEFFEALLNGKQPQLPLYSLVAERLMGLQVAGLIQIYLRSAAIRGLKMQAFSPLFDESNLRSISAEEKQQMIANVQSLLERKANFIADGILTAYPDDFESCGPGGCAYADLCRFRGKPYETNGSRS